jgi:hypothetical protein
VADSPCKKSGDSCTVAGLDGKCETELVSVRSPSVTLLRETIELTRPAILVLQGKLFCYPDLLELDLGLGLPL